MSDPDAIGPDGTVRLRCYARHLDSMWFAAGCTDCGRQAAIGVRPAIEIMGSGDATAGQLQRRLRCSGCGGRRVYIQIAADPWPPPRSGSGTARCRRPAPIRGGGDRPDGAPATDGALGAALAAAGALDGCDYVLSADGP